MKHSYRYNILFMMVIMVIINYIDRGAISYAQEDIIAEYGFGTVEWGAVLGYFGYGYLFGALFGGALADKKGPKFVWIIIDRKSTRLNSSHVATSYAVSCLKKTKH